VKRASGCAPRDLFPPMFHTEPCRTARGYPLLADLVRTSRFSDFGTNQNHWQCKRADDENLWEVTKVYCTFDPEIG
jgi:hypothetical protein